MRVLAGILAGALVVLSSPALAQQEPAREVNITAGSTPGWIPSEELEEEAKATFARYYQLLEDRDFGAAHAMMGPGLQKLLPLPEFAEQELTANQDWGRTIARKVTKITWTKDAPSTPNPGIYVALDMTARFANVDRHCGYMILYQAPDADDFVIVRTENTILDNRAASSIAEENSQLQMELVWRIVARSCPNYVAPELPGSLADGIEYASVGEARAALERKDGTQVRQENGWTIIADRTNLAVWSFAPVGDPSYPSALKRWVVPVGPDSSEMSMGLLCEVEKPICDSLFEEMALINGFIPISMEQ